MARTVTEPMDTSHPWAASPGRFPIDDRLRAVGFEILSRPEEGPVMWTRGGQKYTQRQAVLQANRERAP